MEDAILAATPSMESTPNTTPQKATTPTTTSSQGGWWGLGWNIVETVKKQTESVISIYKEDLQEFTKTIQDDVKDVIKKTAVATNNLANTNTAPQKSKMDELELSLDRRQARITALQNELSTFVTEPTEVQDFQEWKSTWNIQHNTEQISKLLAENEKMRAIHTKLVPVVISYATFWERYFYKLHKLLLEEERRAALVQKAVATTDEEELAWDDDIDDATPRKEATQEAEPVVPKAELEDYFNKLDVEDNHEQAPSSPTKKEAPSVVVSEKEQPVETEQPTTPVAVSSPVSSSPPKPSTPQPASPATPTTNTTTPVNNTKPAAEEEAWDSWE